jgi:hypothetical protein
LLIDDGDQSIPEHLEKDRIDGGHGKTSKGT